MSITLAELTKYIRSRAAAFPPSWFDGQGSDTDYARLRALAITICDRRTVDYFRNRMRSDAQLRRFELDQQLGADSPWHAEVAALLDVTAVLSSLPERDRELLLRDVLGSGPQLSPAERRVLVAVRSRVQRLLRKQGY